MNNNPQKNSSTNIFFRLNFLSKKRINPERDWKILTFFFIVLIILSIGFDAYIYEKIVSGDMYVNVQKNELMIENLKKDDLKKILDNFEAKKANFPNLKLQKLVDPSL